MLKNNLTCMKLASIIGLASLLSSGIDFSCYASETALDKAACLTCHDSKKGKLEITGKSGEKRALGTIDTQKFGKSIHGDMQCVECHRDITDSQARHVKSTDVKPANCISCHEALWEAAKKEKLSEEKERLGLVVQNIAAYKNSFHARPDKDDPTRANATCEDCHSSHAFSVPPKGTARRTVWHRGIPATCGEKCHEDQLETYKTSIHGEELLEKGNLKAADCTDCHSAHSITTTTSNTFKLANVRTCGGCHKEELDSYTDTYHGKVGRLGYTYTARCVDCHDSHGVLAVDDPKSEVNPNNRLKTCQKCHSDKKPNMHDATAGFVTFSPHANSHDFKKYPQVYIATKFMIALLVAVFTFFWVHSILWWHREYMDKKQGKTRPHIRTDALPAEFTTKHVRRFGLMWRIGHLIFALSVMALVLTGMTVFYHDAAWAKAFVAWMGGPHATGQVHRAAAFTMLGIFFIHLIAVSANIVRNWKSFRFFGPDSLVPNWKDWEDMIGMFKWFIGAGPRPTLERWTYWEKFDYWAVFWGMAIIGGSGMTLAFPHLVATVLPGWVFNVASIIHGEEAFLAAVFLFTVHFYNNHFRPDKLPPPDVVMFTGTQSLEEFRHEHPAHYQRLLESGEISKYLVDAPSRSMHVGSVILGLGLLALGFVLLVLVGVGFFGEG